ncbi:50S ribosomal protein L18 [Buchnera aphidicola (Cinara tujafilina)]|uniref:Large ribosomal subunit protein uL18 n=1 Tax=Buchnera aphidicola (Cinara tujafilina) TaxID=261317 RepID=F7WZN4_9GAMM|nr:50S ribosomal protein L18 [Buchnera aphidicola]AEH39901.1 50S ribosomal protein L18 [Buchnera aphidicola (Cinara tujafilina)]
MKGQVNKNSSRMRRYMKLRKKIQLKSLFRLIIHRSSKHIYAQIISNENARVITCASTLEKNHFNIAKIYTGNKISARLVGELIAKRALLKGIKKVSFDRSGFKYHGRIKSLAESARSFGLIF